MTIDITPENLARVVSQYRTVGLRDDDMVADMLEALAARVAELEAASREITMCRLSDLGQAQDAWEAQKAAEARLAERDAENARMRWRLDRGLKWCDMMDGPSSKSQFVNGQATAAQQIRAALEGEKP